MNLRQQIRDERAERLYLNVVTAEGYWAGGAELLRRDRLSRSLGIAGMEACLYVCDSQHVQLLRTGS